MKVAFVCGAYRAPTINGIRENIEKARAVSLELWEMGFAVICPHANTAFFDGACPDEVWLAGAQEMLKRCDLVVTVPGWGASSGANLEVELALMVGIEVLEWPDAKEDLMALADRE